MQLKKELIKRTISGDTVLVPIGSAVYDANGLFVLNELGGFLWDLLPQAEDIQQLVDAVLAEYEVDEATARRDISAFLEALEKLGIL
ncbi:MAG: PqqD family protein [Oscillospiraceae bacterium]|nr:PqqD family protein [Oscillospiraceae bacterium]